MLRKRVYVSLIILLVVVLFLVSGCNKGDISGAAVVNGHEVIRIALTENDPYLCDQIDIQSGINSKDTCYSVLALSMKQISLCDNVLGKTRTENGVIDKDVCVEKVTEVLEREQKIEKTKIIYEEAFQDPSACKKIEEAIPRDVCFENVAVQNKETKICEMMENSDGKQECLFRVILLLGDQSLCSELEINSGKYSRNLCYNNIAQNLLDPTICKKINVESGPFSQDACLGSIAVVTKEKAVCEMINVADGVISQESCMSLI